MASVTNLVPIAKSASFGLHAISTNPRRVTSRNWRISAEGDKQKGVLPGLNQWPPKPITEHGAPKPEDDPKNYNVITGERTGGPSEAEIAKKKEEAKKDRPFSNPDRSGGTQRGGGGEGSAA